MVISRRPLINLGRFIRRPRCHDAMVSGHNRCEMVRLWLGKANFSFADVYERCVIFDIGTKYCLITAIHYQKSDETGKTIEGRVYVRNVLRTQNTTRVLESHDCGADFAEKASALGRPQPRTTAPALYDLSPNSPSARSGPIATSTARPRSPTRWRSASYPGRVGPQCLSDLIEQYEDIRYPVRRSRQLLASS